MALSPSPAHQRTAVPVGIRNEIVARHLGPDIPDPNAADDPRMVALLGHLYVPDAVDNEDGAPLICARTLAALEGKQAQHAAKNYVARFYVQEYRERVDPSFEWTDYDAAGGRCRRASCFDHDEDLLAEARAPHGPDQGDLVYVADGSPVTADSRAADLHALRQAATQSGAPLDRRVEWLMDYLNGLPSNRFTAAVRRHHDQAAATVEALLEAGQLTESERQAALAALRATVAQPTPVYQLSKRFRTQRLFPASSGLLTLKSEVSEVLRADWGTYDLTSAQTAINAVDWEADHVAGLLAAYVDEPGFVWRLLAEHVGTADVAGVKKALKTALYSIQYGKDVGAVAHDLDRAVGSGAGDAVLSGPFMADLIRARDAAIASAEHDGGVVGAFEEWIPIEPGRDAPSVLAERAQGVELSLLLPAVELAAAADRWDIVLWQHDGFDVAVRDPSRWSFIDRQLRGVVDAECQRLGYPTRLVCDRRPSGPDWGGRSAARPGGRRPPTLRPGRRV